MLLEEFKKLTRHTPIINVKKYDQRHRELIALKKLTEHIDFGCNFGENRRACRRHVKSFSCCCDGCKSMVGYLLSIEKNKVKRYARHFHQEYGFWRKGKGCILPREDRSPLCLTFSCRHLNNITKKEKEDGVSFYDAMIVMRHTMEDLEKELIAEFRV